MGFLSRGPKPAAPLVGTKEVIVVGEERLGVVRSLRQGPVSDVTIEPAKATEYDSAPVLVRVGGRPAGYLSAARSKTYRPMLSGQHPVEAVVKQAAINAPDLALFVLLPRPTR